MTICYFTATGNCLYVARRIDGTLLSIPQLMKQREIDLSDDAVGVVAPVYAGEMPMMVRDFLKKAKITKEALRKEVSMSSEKEYIQNGENPYKIRIFAVFLCLFADYLWHKSASRFS